MDSLPAGVIRWGHELSEIRIHDDASVRADYARRPCETFDLVVGADGAWSRVRPIVSEARPVYSGVAFIEMGIDDVDTRYPELSQLVGRGMTFAMGDSKALVGHRNANAHLSVNAALRVPEDWIERGGLDMSSPHAMKRSLAGHFCGWSETLLELIHRSDDRMTPRAIHVLPAGHQWEHRPGVTLLGDAAHLDVTLRRRWRQPRHAGRGRPCSRARRRRRLEGGGPGLRGRDMRARGARRCRGMGEHHQCFLGRRPDSPPSNCGDAPPGSSTNHLGSVARG